MKHQLSKSSIYVAGAARFHYLVYLVTKDRKLVADDVEHSRFIAFQRGELAHMGDKNWSTVAMCVVQKPNEKLVAISEDGDVFTYVKGVAETEEITPRPLVLRGLGVVDGFAFACGMKRQVYRRGSENSWIEMHAPEPPSGQNSGFEDIAGFSVTEIYAVGWNGEIWQWNGKNWLQHVCPTNLIMTAVCCGEDDNVYVCGQNGTILRGRNQTWEIVDSGVVTDDFWDICWFDGAAYVASMTDLYRLSSGGLAPVNFGEDSPGSCNRLTAAEGVLWSIGSDDVFKFEKGQWVRVD